MMAAQIDLKARNLKSQLLRGNNVFYRNNHANILYSLMGILFCMLIVVVIILVQTRHRPLPTFVAVQSTGEKLQLIPFTEPSLLSDTILRWASKGATIAYTFDFVNYAKEINAARSYFTDAGWSDYVRSVRPLIQTIVQNQLFVNGVVAGSPVISNQGVLPGRGYVWRVQIPFLVTYQTSDTTRKQPFTVVLTIVRVPTSTNPQGIGIDQFVMV